jgi:hypothetical protein
VHPKATPQLLGGVTLVDCALEAAQARRIVAPAEAPKAGLITHLATQELQARDRTDRDLEALLPSHPGGALAPSPSGMGAVPAAEVIDCTGTIRRSGRADRLGSVADRAPVKRQSG